MDPFEHFIKTKSKVYAGNHIIVDLWGIINHSDDKEIIKNFENACELANATVLKSHCHHFGEGCGTTGVIVLAESHASWHHWPECNLLCVDFFMCGSAEPKKALEEIIKFWKPTHVEEQVVERGMVRKPS